MVTRLAIDAFPVAGAIEGEVGVLRRDCGRVGTDKTDETIGGIVSILLVVHRVMQFALSELVVHAVVGMRKAHNQRAALQVLQLL